MDARGTRPGLDRPPQSLENLADLRRYDETNVRVGDYTSMWILRVPTLSIAE